MVVNLKAQRTRRRSELFWLENLGSE